MVFQSSFGLTLPASRGTRLIISCQIAQFNHNVRLTIEIACHGLLSAKTTLFSSIMHFYSYLSLSLAHAKEVLRPRGGILSGMKIMILDKRHETHSA